MEEELKEAARKFLSQNFNIANMKDNDEIGRSMEQKRWYMCDPTKNTACKKRTCKYNPLAIFRACDKTSNPAYAFRDRNNRPMEAEEMGWTSERR